MMNGPVLVQESGQGWISVIPAQAGIQGRLVISLESSLGSGFRRSDGGRNPGFIAKNQEVLKCQHSGKSSR
jgi:hypothetical protein